MKNTTELLFHIIRSALCAAPVEGGEESLTIEEARELFALAKHHDLAHIVANALLGADAIPTLTPKLQPIVFKAIYRYEGQAYELTRLRETLETRGIPFVPLKGALLRDLYPEPWMRTSCDIDILVKKEDLERAKTGIIEALGYEHRADSSHDVTLFSKSGVCLELHFDLQEPGFSELVALDNLWESGELRERSLCEYEMSSELFLLYHIYHMAKHFVHGGCGIKPLIDLWLIRNKMPLDESRALTMLKEGGLLEFYKKSIALCDVWLGDGSHDSTTREMEEYILQGGVYGTLEQQLAMSQSRKGGKGKHLLSKIFLPYRSMLIYYPSLRKAPVLYPMYQVRRWLRILFFGGSRRALREVKLNQNLSLLKQQKAQRLIDALHLQNQ